MRKPTWERAGEESPLGQKGFETADSEAGKSRRERMISAQSESLLRSEREKMESGVDMSVQQKAQETAASAIAVVTAKNTSGTYNIKFCDGRTATHVQNSYGGATWVVGTWVTVERVGKDWQIAGISPWGAGVFDPGP